MSPRRPPIPTRSTRPNRPLTRDLVIATALRVLDAEGLEAVTMRRVAVELDTGAASLYAHVSDKDDLYAALVDRVIGEVAIPADPDPARWQEQLKDVMRNYRAALSGHRDVARAGMGVIPTGPNALPAMDRLVAILLAGDLRPQVVSWGLDILSLYVTALAYEESMDEWPRDDPAAVEEHRVQLEGFFAALPAATYPHLAAIAGPLTTGDADERFEFGLDVLVRGIAAAGSAPDNGSGAATSRRNRRG